MDRPETRYVAVGDADVAYQIVGDGRIDLLYCYGLGSHVDMFWEHPATAETLERLASFSRLIFFDRRGTGASDRFQANVIPTWEEWTEDMVAVLDAAGSESAAILGVSDGGGIAMAFAAMHPKRVWALVLLNTAARFMAADDFPMGVSPESVDALVEMLAHAWGTPELAQLTYPSMANDADAVQWMVRCARASSTPRSAASQLRQMLRSDRRQTLPLITAPTLVLRSRDYALAPVEVARYVAEHISGAIFVEVPGADHGLTPSNTAMLDEIAAFLTGEHLVVEADRILTTVLFTDIVGSTAQAAAMGDQRWRALLDTHDRTVRDQLRRFRGREINTTGDGFVASFDGPARAIRCAQAIADATSKLGIELRIGLHTGECEVRGDDLGGLAVHVAARVGALADPGRILVSGVVTELVAGSGIEFTERGEHELKGVPGSWELFAVRA